MIQRRPNLCNGEGIVKKIYVLASVLAFIGCGAAHGPVLYPNEHFKNAGELQAQKDIDECSHKAEQYVKDNPGAKVAGSTVGGGVGGAMVGGAAGAVSGGLGKGAAIGAAAGAAAGLFRGLVKASQPSPVYKSFVDRCLREKGYEPLGWNE